MDGDLIRSCICLVNSVKRILDSKNKEYGFSGSQIRCLHVIYRANSENKEINQKDLESVFNLQKSSISGLLTSMEEKGLIVRIPSSKDSRHKAIELTDKGKEFNKITYYDVSCLQKEASKGIKEEDLLISIATLRQMLINLEGEEYHE